MFVQASFHHDIRELPQLAVLAASVEKRQPVDHIEDEKEEWKEQEEEDVQPGVTPILLLPPTADSPEDLLLVRHVPVEDDRVLPGVALPRGGDLHFEQEPGVLDEGAEDEEDADDDPGLDGSQTLGLGDVGSDCVENVHQHKEHSHQESHATWTEDLKKKKIMSIVGYYLAKLIGSFCFLHAVCTWNDVWWNEK